MRNITWTLGILLVAALAACSSTPAGGGTSDAGDGGGSDGSGCGSQCGDGGGGDEGPSCVDLDHDGFGPGCALGDDCLPNDPTSFPGAEEQCGDGLDNDCDSRLDDGCPCPEGALQHCYEGPEGTLGRGSCADGYQQCAGGEWGECVDQILPSEEACDGVDNNCDGAIDEGVTNACGQCGDVPLEVCGDVLDNDCDGVMDETDAGCFCDGRTAQPCYTGPPLTLGRGICSDGVTDCICPGGAQFCADGQWGACMGQVLPQTETCDGADNDCDGLVDEGLRNACGECDAETPSEVCDGMDNDCDGEVDEGLRLACGLCPGEQAEEETCGDGFDNNCDGLVDEICACVLGDPTCYPGPPETVGQGTCSAGTRACDSTGEFWGPCSGYTLPALDVCDGLDNDCDGTPDVDARGCSVCGSDIEVCDGLDNNCDGTVDEFVRNRCGVCVDEVVQEETLGFEFCNGTDDDCDGLTDEGLLNACGTCDQSCYVETWNEPGDWEGGDSEGVEVDVDGGIRLGTRRFTFPDLWIANSSDDTVTRIDTNTATVVGTYPVGVRPGRGDDSPSRTAVDFDGNAWVANRAFGGQGSLSKIRVEGCTGADCVSTLEIGGSDELPRGLAIDAEGYAWVGTFNGQRLYRVNPENTAVVESYNTGLQIYGLAVDSEGIIWISTISGQGIGAFSTATRSMIGNWAVPGGCTAPYGIAVDGDGNVWAGNWSCHTLLKLDRASFDAGSPSLQVFSNSALSHTRGVAVDGEGYVWLAASNSNRLTKFDPRTSSFVGTYETCNTPIGVGVASDGNIWVMCYNDNLAQRFSTDGTHLANVPVGSNPYSYSDMTGFQLRNFTAPRGTWRRVFDCGFADCAFDQVTWAAVLPAGTTVSARARTSPDAATWSPWSTSDESSPASLGDEVPRGRYCEVELSLATTVDDVTPLVTDVQVFWQRP